MLFGLLNLPSVQEAARKRIVEELKTKLDTELDIGELHFQPFNTIELKNISLYDRKNNDILKAERLYANVDLLPLLRNEVIINAVSLSNFHVDLSKDSSNAPLNIQFIIDAFKPKDDTKKTSFDVKISSLNINNGTFRFDIKDKPYKDNQFDNNHIFVSDLNANMALKSLKTDSLNIQIKRLSLEEKSGVKIQNLTARVISQDKTIQVKGFRLELPHSLLQFDDCSIDLKDGNLNGDFIKTAEITCSIVSSYITPKDVSGFTPIFRNFKDRIFLNAKVKGTINDLTVPSLSLDYGDKMTLRTNATVKNFTDKDNLYLAGSVEKLYVTTEGLKGLLANFSDKEQKLPQEVENMGNISFHGNISGQLKSLKAHGVLHGNPGTVETDLVFGFNPEKGIDSYFNGKIYAKDFNLQELTGNSKLDKLSFDLLVDLKKQKNHKMGGKVEGVISEFDYNNYTYHNVTLNGEYNGTKAEGKAVIDDENIYLALDGLFDLDPKETELNFKARLRSFRPDKLNLSDKFTNSFLSLNLDANFKGNHIDNAIGSISIDSLNFYRDGQALSIKNFVVESSEEDEGKKISIRSDIINGEIVGNYSFTTIANSLKKTLNPYLPALIPLAKSQRIDENNFTLNFTVGNTEKLSNILSFPVTFYSDVNISGFYNNLTDKLQLEVFYPSAKIAGSSVKSGYFKVENNKDKLISSLSGIVLGKKYLQNNFELTLDAANNTVNTSVFFDNVDKKKFNGKVNASALFSREEGTNKLKTDIAISPSQAVWSDTTWVIEKSHIQICPGVISVDNFNIHSALKDQFINIDGKYSAANPDDEMKIDLENIDLEYIFTSLAIDALNFGGRATGTLLCSNVDGSPYANVNLKVDDFKFNNTNLGLLNLYSEVDEKEKKVNMKGTILDKDSRLTNIDGFINPLTQELSMHFDADKIDIAFLNKYASSLFNNVTGQGTGKVHLYGNFSKVTIEGKAFIEEGSLGINFLNTRYLFTDTVYLKKDLIYFNDVTFYDQNKSEAKVSGKVAHDFFSDFMYYVELHGNDFMLYNASEQLNPMFFGTLYGSGTGSISGNEQVVNINAQLRTNKNSRIRMNFMEETVNEYSFVTYKSQESDTIQGDNKKPQRQIGQNALKSESGMEINMNFYVDATPDAVVEIVMDPIGGDILRGAGSGALQFVWGTKTDPRLYGTYVINDGSYNFTFQKIIERKFIIKSGSSVLFRGDPFQANLNVDALYRLNANLNDLDADLAQRAGQTSIPVECILNITGELQQPNIRLDVALPTADAEVQRQVKSLMNNEDMVNRQMVYLLILSKFYTPGNTNDQYKSSDFASLASATLSTQLSKILSGIDDKWQFGTNIRTSDGAFTSTEVELLLSSRLLNNRLLINGNFGYRDDPNLLIQNAFIRDVDVEYLLNPAGTWRVKAYNHFNEKFYYKSADNNSIETQGVGIMYKKDFDSFGEVFGAEPRYKAEHKMDSVKPILPDSTVKGSSLGQFIRIK